MCNCNAQNPAPALGAVRGLLVEPVSDMTDANSEEVTWIGHPMGMTHYIGSQTSTHYKVWEYGQLLRIYKADLLEFETLGYV